MSHDIFISYSRKDLKQVIAIRDEIKEVASTTYYDLTGRMISNPDAGIYVKVVRYTDGSQRSFKVLKK